jgi:hypothetical protein
MVQAPVVRACHASGMSLESPVGVVAQAVVALALIVGAGFLAYIDPNVRGQLGGAFVLSIGAVIGYFFSQRAVTAGAATTLKGMSHMAGLIAADTPGPVGAPGPGEP